MKYIGISVLIIVILATADAAKTGQMIGSFVHAYNVAASGDCICPKI
jgi:hypothetical protein